MSKTPEAYDGELEIIGAGFGRTGTSSLKAALEILGYGPCHHMSYLAGPGKIGRCKAFIDAYQGKPTDWRALMHGFRSTLDEPTSDFVLPLLSTFPNAKVILTVRDSPEAWYSSFLSTLARIDSLWTGVLVFSLPPLWTFWRVGRCTRAWRKQIYGSHGPEAYKAHIERMKREVPKEKLLVFNVKQGWEPLCEFLGVPVPEGEFPRVNESEEMRRAVWVGRVVGAVGWVVELGLLGLLVRWAVRGRWWELQGVRRFLPEL